MNTPVLGLFQMSMNNCCAYQLSYNSDFNIVDFENEIGLTLDNATPRYKRRPYGFYDLNFENSHPLLDVVPEQSNPSVCCPVYRVKFKYDNSNFYIYYLYHINGNNKNKYGMLILPITTGLNHFTFLKDRVGVFAFNIRGYNRNRKQYMDLANSFHYFESLLYKHLRSRYFIERGRLALSDYRLFNECC